MNAPTRPLGSNKKLYGSLVAAIYFFFLISQAALRAKGERDTATRQQTSFGTIDQCELRGRFGTDTYCHYTFLVGDEVFAGVNRAPSHVQFGQTMVVYYDAHNPSVNGLEDFSAQSRKDADSLYILLVALAVTIALIIQSRPSLRGP